MGFKLNVPQAPQTLEPPKPEAFSLAPKKKTTKPPKEKDVLRGIGLTQKLVQKDQAATNRQEKALEEQHDFRVWQAKKLLDGELDEPIIPDQPPSVKLTDTILTDDLLGQGIVYDASQIRAILGAAREKFAIINGPAGCGKTTSLKAVVAGIEHSLPVFDRNLLLPEKQRKQEPDMQLAIAFCCFMGKGAQQMKRSLPEKYHIMVDTIHGTLGYAPEYVDYLNEKTNEWDVKKVFRPTFNRFNKLPYKAVVIDEGQSCAVYLWNELVDALEDDCRVILMGDINQIPPVSGHSVLGHAILKWPTFELNTIHRTAADSAIITNAHRVLAGHMPEHVPDKQFFIQNINDGSNKAFQEIFGIVKLLHSRAAFDPMLDALIVPQNVGGMGGDKLNSFLVQYFNPPVEKGGVVINPRQAITAGYEHKLLAIGDKIMLNANNRPLGLTNGMVGIIEDIRINDNFRGEIVGAHAHLDSEEVDIENFELESVQEELAGMSMEELETANKAETERASSHIVTINFQNYNGGLVNFSSAGDINKLAHAYAFTCHKAQGSEFRNVLLVTHSANIRMLCREWIYTAITRAKEKVVILCNRRGLQQSIYSQRIRGNTAAEKAQKFIELAKVKKDDQLPTLPEPTGLELKRFHEFEQQIRQAEEVA